jgi:hypothetical protein
MAEKRKLPDNQITVYQTSDGKVNIEVQYTNGKYEVAVAFAQKEYDSFRKIQDEKHFSDFDKELKRISGKKDDSKQNHRIHHRRICN